MYKNLSPDALGISGRQSELIELALTYGFRGLDVDAAELIKRSGLQGVEEANRYLHSAKLRVNGFRLPADLQADEVAFKADMEKLAAVAEVAKRIGFRCCATTLAPASETLPYHENFETHRVRLGRVAELLAKFEIRLGVGLSPVAAERQGRRFQFIHQAEELVTLLKSVGVPNVGLVLDTWNWRVGNGRLEQVSELKGQPVVSVRLAEVPEDADLATITPAQRLLPGDRTAAEHAALLRLLAERNYDGPITIAPHPTQVAERNRDTVASKCSGLLDQLWAAAGLTKTGRLP